MCIYNIKLSIKEFFEQVELKISQYEQVILALGVGFPFPPLSVHRTIVRPPVNGVWGSVKCSVVQPNLA